MPKILLWGHFEHRNTYYRIFGGEESSGGVLTSLVRTNTMSGKMSITGNDFSFKIQYSP